MYQHRKKITKIELTKFANNGYFWITPRIYTYIYIKYVWPMTSHGHFLITPRIYNYIYIKYLRQMTSQVMCFYCLIGREKLRRISRTRIFSFLLQSMCYIFILLQCSLKYFNIYGICMFSVHWSVYPVAFV